MKTRTKAMIVLITLMLLAVACQAPAPPPTPVPPALPTAGPTPTAAASGAALRPQNVLYQIAWYGGLPLGHFDGLETVGEIKSRGNLGLGTFDTLDGEMVLVDGQVYQILDTGAAVPAADSGKLASALATNYSPTRTRELGALPTLAALKAELDKLIVHRELFYAFRIEGTFTQIKLRNLSKQQKPYPLLTVVYGVQPAFEFQNIKGTLVGVWSPDYLGTISAAGYNLHFISADRKQGGHILESALTDAQVSLAEMSSYQLNLRAPGE